MNIPAPFTENQIKYLLKTNYSWFNVAEGGKRGAKNVINTLAWCNEIDIHPDRFHLAAGVDQSSARINILECDGFGVKNYFDGCCRIGKFEKKDCLYIDTKTGQKIIFFAGGKKSGDDANIKGYTYGTAYITEANECHSTFIQEVFDRTIASNNRKIFHDLNPKSPNHVYYTDILDFHEEQQNKDPEYGYNWGHFTLLDNLSISDIKLKSVLKTYDKGTVHYERDILGLRKQAEGLIYKRFANNPQNYYLDYSKNEEEIRSGKKKQLPRMIEINIGLDFGGNKSAHAIVATGITPNYQKLIGLASKRIFHKDYKEGIAPADVDKFVVEFVGFIIKEFGRCDYLEWDNEAVTLGTGVKRAVEKSYPQVTVRGCYKAEINDRIDLMQKLIGEDRFLYTRHCETLKEALKTAIWNPVPAEIGIDERLDDGTSDIDSLDGLEYTITRQLRRFIQ